MRSGVLDLAPARRHTARSRRPAVLALVLLIAAVGTALWWFLLRTEAGGTAAAPAPACAVAPAPAPTGPVHLRVLNGTARTGLAKAVGTELTARGFVVDATGNAPAQLAGESLVLSGPGGEPAAAAVAAQVLGSRAALVPAAAAGTATGPVDLTLGSAYERLRTPPEVAALPPAAPPPAPGCR